MNPAPDHEDWLDAVQGRPLPAERLTQLRRELVTRPREAARLEEELALNAALDGLPAAPVASNFTARVLAEIEREDRVAERHSPAWLRWLAGLRFVRPTAAVALLALALTGLWQFRLHQRTALATSVAEVSRAAAVPGVELLPDFEAIQLLRTGAQPGDVELLAALDTDPITRP